jgi:hypothetical protein
VLREDLRGRITLAAGSASNPAKAPKPAELLPARARRTRKSRVVVPPSPADTSTVEHSHASSELARRRYKIGWAQLRENELDWLKNQKKSKTRSQSQKPQQARHHPLKKNLHIPPVPPPRGEDGQDAARSEQREEPEDAGVGAWKELRVEGHAGRKEEPGKAQEARRCREDGSEEGLESPVEEKEAKLESGRRTAMGNV